MTASPAPIEEIRDIDPARFRAEIVPRGKPVVLRGIARHWPAVEAGRASPHAMSAYLQRLDSGREFVTLVGSPAIKGRFFYGDTLNSVNFKRNRERLAASLQRVLEQMDQAEPLSVFIQSAPVSDYLPDFVRENSLAVLDPSIAPRIWIGNSVAVQTHFDPYDNIACVVCGRRRFTLFPPEQVSNLYVGPIDASPSGAPVSMVLAEEPDLERYPRFADALAAAQNAELEAGDGIFIPYLWWHHVRSLERFNVLINYWWSDAKPYLSAPFEFLLHAVLALRDLPPGQREAWRAMLDNYIFQTHGDPLGHLPPEHRGMLGPLDADRAAKIRAVLQRALNR